jgi:hypothetical protein
MTTKNFNKEKQRFTDSEIYRQFSAPLCLCISVLCLLLFACAPSSPPNNSGLQAVTAVPTLDPGNAKTLCDVVSAQWGHDWTTSIRALEALNKLNTTCADGLAIPGRLYTAYLAYGTLLEQRGRKTDAIKAYQAALNYNKLGTEAATRLKALDVYTPQPPQRCEPAVVSQAVAKMTAYTPTVSSYVRIDGSQFTLDGKPYPVYGIDYYPRDYPYKRFLAETKVDSITFELDLLKAAGLNTLRIFARHDALFTCPGNGAIPVADNFARLDAFIRAAAARGFKLIIVLNDAPDLTQYPLYDRPPYSIDQLLYIVSRYRNEPAIMAWDLRDAGDLDYTSSVAGESRFDREEVLEWLTETALTVKQTDPNHPITAGWRNDNEATIPAVDFVSFQDFNDLDSLRQRIANLKSVTTKPLLLAAVGYSTYNGIDENQQRDLFYGTFEAVQRNALAGWVVWTAFDYPLNVTCATPGCLSEDSEQYHFGLWNTSYFPKLAVTAIKKITGAK